MYVQSIRRAALCWLTRNCAGISPGYACSTRLFEFEVHVVCSLDTGLETVAGFCVNEKNGFQTGCVLQMCYRNIVVNNLFRVKEGETLKYLHLYFSVEPPKYN